MKRRLLWPSLLILTGAFAYQANAELNWQLISPLPTPRQVHMAVGTSDTVYVFGGNTGGSQANGSTAAYRFSEASGVWTPIASLPSPVGAGGVVALGGYVYVIGGAASFGSYALNSVYRYSPATNSWRTMAPLSQGRRYVGCVALNGFIYAIGGGSMSWSDATTTTRVERYNPADTTSTWSDVAPLPVGQAPSVVAAVGGHIYSIGGIIGSNYSTQGFRYDPGTNTWVSIANVPFYTWASAWSQLVDRNGHIVVLSTDMSLLGIYDPAANTWTVTPNTATVHRDAQWALAATPGYLYLMGGIQYPAGENYPLDACERAAFAGGPAFFTSLTSWTKYAANPVLNVSPGQFDAGHVSSPAVLYDGMYRMWYVGYPGSGINMRIGYATSADGVAWTKYGVVLNVGSGWEGQSIHAPSVIKDGGLYKMWYSGHSGTGWQMDIGYATSPDGQAWTKYASNPVFLGSSIGGSTELYVGTVLKEGTSYKMWYGAASPSLPVHVRYATSPDGITWTDRGQVLGAGSSGSWDEGLGAYCPQVLQKDGLYEMWYGGFRAGVYAIGYATSADGITWTKSPYNPVLNKGSAGSWEGSSVSDPAVLLEGETHKMWYVGSDGTLIRLGYATSGSATARSALSFGNVDLGSSGTQTFTVANAGNAALTVSITQSGADASQFAVSPTSFTINPGGAAQTVTVNLAPTGSPGSRSATLSIAYNAPGGPETVALTGTATGQAAIEVSAPDTFATYNQSLTVPVRVGNTSGSGIVSFELALLYNRRLLSGATVQTAGTLAEGWTIQSNIVPSPDSLDTLKVAAAYSTPLLGVGTLVNVNFQVADVRHPASSPLTLAQVLFNTGEIATTQDHGSLTLVGHNGALFSFPDSILPRYLVQVRLWELEENRHPGTAQSVAVQVRNGSQSEMLTLTEAGVDTAGFFGSIATVFSAAASPPSGDGVVQAKAGDQIVFTFVDSLGASGNTVMRTDTTRVMGGKDGRVRATVVSQPGDTVRVRLTDGDRNFNPGAQDTITVLSAVNGRTGEQETVRVREVSANDSMFLGLLRTALGSSGGANNDGVMLTRKGDVVAFTYQDTITALGGVAVVPDSDYVVNPFGDADGNGQVQAFDAARVLFHMLSPFLIGIDSLSANVDSLAPFGRITPYDASLVLQKRVGLIGRFPVQEDESDNHPQPETDLSTPKPVVAQRVLSLVQGEGYWSVMADERDGILSGEVVLGGIEGKVELAPDLQEYLIASRSGEGMLRVVFAGAVPVSGPGELLRVYLGVGPGRAQLTRAELNDGSLGVVLSGAASTAELPTRYALLGNWPNPFNPETTIAFALPERSVVMLEVYDVLGQRVRVLVDRALPAGQHQVVWDGRDEWGRPVSSGVYMYRLQAGAFSQLKRMVMIK